MWAYGVLTPPAPGDKPTPQAPPSRNLRPNEDAAEQTRMRKVEGSAATYSFVDVRDGTELAASGKVPGALHTPRGVLEFRACSESAMHDKTFDRSKTVIVYCASGGRSALAGKTLKDMGYNDVRNLGGFKDWLEAGGPVEKI